MERFPFVPSLLVGVGLAGTIDEVVLHQLLHWHHFYDRSTTAVGLVSDGLFHLFSTGALALGLYLHVRRRDRADARAWGGVLVGAGGFNLYDAVVQHKLLRLHQVRPGVSDLLPYDLVFTLVSLAVLLAGFALLRRASRRPLPR